MVLNLGCFPLLLMLLGLWSTVCPLCAWPENITKAHWFEIQHIQPNLLQCNRAMGVVNNYDQYCKPKNTFLHDSFQNVAVVCKLPNIKCRDGRRNNCHQSAKPVNMTICRLTSGKYPYCVYSDTAQYRVFIVACDPPQEGDPPYALVPVHLDGLI